MAKIKGFIKKFKKVITDQKDKVDYYALSKLDDYKEKIPESYIKINTPIINKAYQYEYGRNATKEEIEYYCRESLKKAQDKFRNKTAFHELKKNKANTKEIIEALKEDN